MTKRTLQICLPKTESLVEECTKSKELYNSINFLMRQQYFKLCGRKYHGNLTEQQFEIMNNIRFNTNYPLTTQDIKHIIEINGLRPLHSKVTQSLMNVLAKNWKSFFQLKKKQIKCNIPKFKQKYNELNFNKQAISKTSLQRGVLKTYLFEVKVPRFITYENIQACKVKIDRLDNVLLFITYNIDDGLSSSSAQHCAGLDLGLKQLATVGFDTNYLPLSYSGKLLCNVNRKYNYLIAKAQHNSNARLFKKYHTKRNRLIRHIMHNISNQLVLDLQNRDVKTLIIGKNNDWKREINIGRNNNRKFYKIPHTLFINMLVYKCEHVGINVIMQEESYTSKASFIDGDDIPINEPDKKHTFSGKRINRATYESKHGCVLHADVNASYNILSKSKQSDNVKLEKVRHWLRTGFLVVKPLGYAYALNRA